MKQLEDIARAAIAVDDARRAMWAAENAGARQETREARRRLAEAEDALDTLISEHKEGSAK